jgi:hydrogenase/urease accessory protein HupE
MNRCVASRLPVCAIALAVLGACPRPAEAHLNSTGMGPIYDGWMHFVTSLDDVIPVLALALLAGLRGTSYGRRALFVLPAAWLLGGLLGLTAPATSESAAASSLWFLLLGGLVAADAELSLSVLTIVVTLLGLHHGHLNGMGLGTSVASAVALLGITSSVFTLVTLAAASVVQLRAEWVRIAVRVVGSWIAACGILMFGWAMRPS